MEIDVVSLVGYIVPALFAYLAARYKANSELLKLKEQQNAEIEKIKEQAKHDIKSLQIEMDKQAELYEKNAQTDVVSELFGQYLSGDSTGLEQLMKLQKQIDSGTFKDTKHPARKHKKKK